MATKLTLGTAALALASVCATTAAQAADWHRDARHEWRDNGWRDHGHWDHGRWAPYGYYPGPAYYYGGPIYYGPPTIAPPVITYAQPGLSVGLALR